jgi:hypothetical protein
MRRGVSAAIAKTRKSESAKRRPGRLSSAGSRLAVFAFRAFAILFGDVAVCHDRTNVCSLLDAARALDVNSSLSGTRDVAGAALDKSALAQD